MMKKREKVKQKVRNSNNKKISITSNNEEKVLIVRKKNMGVKIKSQK